MHPLTADRWRDLETLFGPKGAFGGCWCMFWRQSGAEFRAGAGAPNHDAFRALVQAREPTGVLAYRDGRAVGWCAVSPRERFGRLERSRTLKRLDDRPVWSVVCLYVAKPYRHQGLSVALLRGAREYAVARGARVVEGYPATPAHRTTDASMYMGTASAFRAAGFSEMARPSADRRVMRYAAPAP